MSEKIDTDITSRISEKFILDKKVIYSKLFEIEANLEKCSSDSMSLMQQNPSFVLFYFNLYRLTKNENYYTIGEAVLEKIIDNLNSQKYPSDFVNGYSGIFWLIQHLNNNSFIEVPSDFFDKSLEEMLLDFSTTNFKNKIYDFLYGGFGPCLFILENQYSPNEEYYKKVITLLTQTSFKDSDGIYWEDYLADRGNSEIVVSLGLSHGMPSIIYFLSRIIKANINNQKTEATYLLENAVNWLLKQKLPNSELSCFSKKKISGETSKSSSLAWCFGDLGVASAVWQAAKVLNKKEWENEAIEIMLHASKRKDVTENHVSDGSFCHGTAGIAHIFNRFYKETNLKEFDEARWYWLQRTLDRAIHPDGIAGFKSWQGPGGWKYDFSLIEGVSGIGLVLMGFLTDDITDLSWDRCFLLN